MDNMTTWDLREKAPAQNWKHGRSIVGEKNVLRFDLKDDTDDTKKKYTIFFTVLKVQS